jgi:O-methyltransferase involved in polyketide biosynthesis
LFGRIGSQARKALVLCEGLLIYLSADEVAALAQDLAAPSSFLRWGIDLASPGLLRMVQRTYATESESSVMTMRFGPAEGPPFFEPYGWGPAEVHSILKTAARKGRVGFGLRLLARLPESQGRQGARPWSAVCLLARRN